MMRLISIFFKEIQFILKEKKNVLFLFFLPILYAAFFGYVYGAESLKYIPVVVLDQDQSSASRSLVSAFADSERFDIVAVVETQEEYEKVLDCEDALVGIGIPSDFAKHIKTGIGSSVIVTSNGKNLMYPNSALSFAREIITTYNGGLGKKLVEAMGQFPGQAAYAVAPVSMRLRIFNNPTNSYLPFMLPGMVTNGVQIGIMMAVFLAIVREYTNLDLWKKNSLLVILFGKIAAYWILSLAGALLAIGLYVFVYNIPFIGSFFDILILYSSFIFAVVTIGMLFSAMAPSVMVPFHPIEFIYFMPAFLYSGYSWPEFSKNIFTQFYAYLLPMNYIADPVRDILLMGSSENIGHNSLILCCFGLVAFVVTGLVCKKRIKTVLLEAEVKI
ncbi:ABC-2 type transport system permease protein [Propionispira arboris]|uniref:ABC-2 type transport system permease protein n=1 Tax=Propionispira arboris TaxID=84035 RepID=A0A1H7B553_9FIRM|nr:ABC transporter permease [Propionispira arboris]SEJ72843.1 ABC-2 type transport system permease protein [Propionispira arboris]